MEFNQSNNCTNHRKENTNRKLLEKKECEGGGEKEGKKKERTRKREAKES